MSNLYKDIETLCVKRGITVTELCRQTQIPRAVLSELKSGRSKSIGLKHLTNIADYFGVSVDRLMGTEKAPAKEAEADDEMIEILQDFKDNPDLRTLFSLSKKATPEQLRQYAKVIRALRGEGDE